MDGKKITVALAGNPNSGKTCVFNAITGGREKVGNYPGVTVDLKEGFTSCDGADLRIVDLPGTYSLTAHSLDEVVARNFIIDETPDVVINVVDSSNFERNLYLSTQLLELGVPIIIALNMADVAKSRGLRINIPKLSKLLGVPIISTVASKGEGMDELLQTAVATANAHDAAIGKLRAPNYGTEIEQHVRELAEMAGRFDVLSARPRWYATKLLENDEKTIERLRTIVGDDSERLDELLGAGQKLRRHIKGLYGDEAEIILADRRYGYISGACTETIKQTVEARHSRSDQIDKIVTNRILGLPIFAAMMYLVFQVTFLLGNPIVDWLDLLINEQLIGFLSANWGGDGILRDLVIHGVIAGVGAVLVFLPLIVLLFLGVAFLEDTGYMARAAFIMDGVMHKFGLHGKSFIPMLIGFGCTVPGVMAARTLDNRRDRITTILVLPLMSCGARMPIYMLILAAFFPAKFHTPMLWSIYVIGIVLAIFCAKILRLTVLRGEAAPFVMELPPYRLPTIMGLLVHMGERSWSYIRKAGTIILAASVILWVITSYPKSSEIERDYEIRAAAVQVEYQNSPDALEAKLGEIKAETSSRELQYTVAGRVGHFIEPVLKPMGFDWRIGTALIGATAAKEIFVTQLGIVFSVDDPDSESRTLQEKLQANYSPLVGFCIMLYCLISMPCIATFAVTVREAGGWKWGFFLFGYLTALAWIVTTLVYQAGQFFV
ncbi:MAG: ferrous iron transport protein B [Phycisphaerae bacterium]|nr:ferrous iron transport protein B [Phycisphaerae bacterium]